MPHAVIRTAATTGAGRAAAAPLLPAAAALLLLAMPWAAHGHGHGGFLLKPQSRNIQSFYYDAPETKEYAPQGLSAGGKGGQGRGEGGRSPACTRDVWARPAGPATH